MENQGSHFCLEWHIHISGCLVLCIPSNQQLNEGIPNLEGIKQNQTISPQNALVKRGRLETCQYGLSICHILLTILHS